MPPSVDNNTETSIFDEDVSIKDQQISSLQESLEKERDARLEERFLFIVTVVLLFDIVFFSVMPTFGGPLALLVLELLVLIPLAKRMGMEEIATIFSNVVARVAGSTNNREV